MVLYMPVDWGCVPMLWYQGYPGEDRVECK